MGKFKDRMERFMSGRYGVDQLYYAMLVLCLVLMVVNIFVKSAVISVLAWAFLICIIFRSFSRSVYKRRMENERFLMLWNLAKAKCSLTIRRMKEIRTHRFRRCRHCKAVLRLPRKGGQHTVQCPRCHKEFQIRILL